MPPQTSSFTTVKFVDRLYAAPRVSTREETPLHDTHGFQACEKVNETNEIRMHAMWSVD